jgi:hypothetical protein
MIHYGRRHRSSCIGTWPRQYNRLCNKHVTTGVPSVRVVRQWVLTAKCGDGIDNPWYENLPQLLLSSDVMKGERVRADSQI